MPSIATARSPVCALILTSIAVSAGFAKTDKNFSETLTAEIQHTAKAMNFSVRCGYPREIVSRFAVYEMALKNASVKGGGPSLASIEQIKKAATTGMVTPPAAVCANTMALVQDQSLRKEALAQKLRDMNKP